MRRWQSVTVLMLGFGVGLGVAWSQDPALQLALSPEREAPQITLNQPASPLKSYDFKDAIRKDSLGSTYIPVDSWVYPAVLRLYSMGFVDTTFLNQRPWTRRSLLHILLQSEADITGSDNAEAQGILNQLMEYLSDEQGASAGRQIVYGMESAYTRLMGIAGTPLRDSYHLGQTLANDYGRPYESGFNSIIGFSSISEAGRFSLYVRGEYQHAPSATGYSPQLSSYLSSVDRIPYSATPPQATIPAGQIQAQDPFRLVEATLSYHLLNHEISLGKSDAWLGPAQGGAMAWSNNAENIYSFRINRVEPLHIPLLSRYLGPIRYDFFVGSLKGHTEPNDPWVHSEVFSMRPTANFEFGFQRTVIWGGHGHGCMVGNVLVLTCNEPITLHTFLKSFLSISDSGLAEKYSRSDPGARFSTFNFSWRLPFMRKHVTLYTDSMVHDDVSPISAPRRAAYRPGLYISQLPGLPKMDLRVEAAVTDTSTLASQAGIFMYFESLQRQGYTNKGFIMGDWIGREAKGGQAWLTWHLSGNEWIQLEYLNKKTPKDFIKEGVTQNQFKVDMVKRVGKNVELEGSVQFERWKAPVYLSEQQNDTVAAGKITWYPKLRTVSR